MTGKTHVAVGCLTMACIAAKNVDGFTVHETTVMPLVALMTTAVGSYLPDIDIPQSHLGQKYQFISKRLKHRGLTHEWYVIPLILFALFIATAFIPSDKAIIVNALLLAFFIASIVGLIYPALRKGNIDLYDLVHGGLMLSAVIGLIEDMKNTTTIASLMFGLLFGWLMHIFADLFNGPGVPLIPGMKNVHIMSVKTRSWEEIVWFLVYATVVLFITFKEYIL